MTDDDKERRRKLQRMSKYALIQRVMKLEDQIAQRAEKKAAEYDRALTARNSILINARTIDGAPAPDQPLYITEVTIDADNNYSWLTSPQGNFVNVELKLELDTIYEMMGIESRRVYAVIHYGKTQRDFVLRQALYGEADNDEPYSQFKSLYDAQKECLVRIHGDIEAVHESLDQLMQWVVNHEDACQAALEGDLQPLKDLATSDQLGPYAANNRELLTIKTRGADRRDYVLWAGERVGQFVQAGRQLSDIDQQWVAQLERDALTKFGRDSDDYEKVRNLTEKRHTNMRYVKWRLGEWMQSWEKSRN